MSNPLQLVVFSDADPKTPPVSLGIGRVGGLKRTASEHAGCRLRWESAKPPIESVAESGEGRTYQLLMPEQISYREAVQRYMPNAAQREEFAAIFGVPYTQFAGLYGMLDVIALDRWIRGDEEGSSPACVVEQVEQRFGARAVALVTEMIATPMRRTDTEDGA